MDGADDHGIGHLERTRTTDTPLQSSAVAGWIIGSVGRPGIDLRMNKDDQEGNETITLSSDSDDDHPSRCLQKQSEKKTLNIITIKQERMDTQRPSTSDGALSGGSGPGSSQQDFDLIPCLTLRVNWNMFQTHGKTVVSFLKSSAKVRPHQKEAVEEVLKMLKDDRKLPNFDGVHKPVIIEAPAGSGKSGIIMWLPYAVEARKVMIITPFKYLSEQLADEFGNSIDKPSFLELAGMPKEQASTMLEVVNLVTDTYNPKKRTTDLTIVNAQKFGGQSGTSLKLRKDGKNLEVVQAVSQSFKEHDLTILDEAHHYPAETWQKIVQVYQTSKCREGQRKIVIFLTATTKRGNGKPILENQEERIAYRVGLKQLEGNTIRKVEFIEKAEKLDDLMFRKKATFKTVWKDIREHLEAQKEQEPRFDPQAMVIVGTIADARLWAKELNKLQKDDADFAVTIVGETGCAKKMAAFSAGKHKVAIICGLMNEGYSNNKVTLCVILRSICSPLLFQQFCGRCTRLYDDGEKKDETVGIIISYPDFNQQKMWDARNKLAEHEDPTDEEDIDTGRGRKGRKEKKKTTATVTVKRERMSSSDSDATSQDTVKIPRKRTPPKRKPPKGKSDPKGSKRRANKPPTKKKASAPPPRRRR